MDKLRCASHTDSGSSSLFALTKPLKDVLTGRFFLLNGSLHDCNGRSQNVYLYHMPSFTLEIIFRILGIGAASGLVLHNGSLYVISDDSAYLYEYSTSEASVNRIPLLETVPMENIPKPQKFDFEAIAQRDGTLYVFGSGSTQNRNTVVKIKYGKCTIHDASSTYRKLMDFAGIEPSDFNIEGAAFYGSDLYLLQRGNGPLSRNGIFVTDADFSGTNIRYTELTLPLYDGNRFGFTDMAVHREKIYFIAASEKALSTYEDGEIAGSVFGAIGIRTLVVEEIFPISKTHKFEGITFDRESAESLEFLLCEDSDSHGEAADIYRLSIKK